MAIEGFQRGRFADAQLVDNQVHRTHAAGATSVHRFLRHLRDAGVTVTPMPIELRYDGTEILEYLPGDSGYPPLSAEVRSDQALVSLATAIRSVHDASRSFQARPMSRVWDLAYAAYHFVPLHPIADLPNWGWTEPPDVSARLAMFLESYGSEISASEVLTTAVMRLIAMSQYIEAEVKEGNSRFDVHARENHAQGYLRAASDLLERILDDAL